MIPTWTPAPQPTATPAATDVPTATPVPAAPAVAAALTHVHYNGANGITESDEHAVIQVTGGSPLEIGGWRIHAVRANEDFFFPSGTVLEPGLEYRVYTNEIHPESGGFSFGSARAIWDNGYDCGYLFDASDIEVSRFCYTPAVPPGAP